MNKKIRTIVCLLLVCVVMPFYAGTEAKAAGGLSISASATQVAEGETFTVTVQGGSNYFVAGIQLQVSGGSIVSNLGKKSLDKGETTSAQIKLTGDTCVVTVSSNDSVYYGPPAVEETASASVTVKKKAQINPNPSPNPTPNPNNNNTVTTTKSKDNKLSSLTVSQGTLTPAFNANTTEYTVNVGGTDKITLGAKANHKKASVTGTGEKTLSPGNNQFVIVCTAENGSKKQYKVNVYVEESPTVHVSYNNQNLGLVQNQTDIGVPTSFERTTVLLEGQEVPAYQSDQMDMTLLYLADEAGNQNFYIYEDGKGITSVFRPVSILGRNVIVYDLKKEEQIRKNMVFSEVTIDGTTLYGWTFENPDFSNYIHISVINEFGQKVIYQYEKTENSLQLYKDFAEDKDDNTEVDKQYILFPDQYYMYTIIGLGTLCVILFICMIYFIASRKHRHEGRKKKVQRDQEKRMKKEEKMRLKEEKRLEKEKQNEE